jgi:carboxyl-terminal processing protease
MKQFFSTLALIGIMLPNASAFRDIPTHGKLYPAINNAIERGILKNGTFFRANDYVPAQMFWELVLRDADFDPESATFGTLLPPNIDEKDPLAPFLREAIRRGFVAAEEDFDKDRFITRIEAIEILVKTKGILITKRVSKAFQRKVSGVPPRTPEYLATVEAAYASKILEDTDVRPLNPTGLLKRKDFITWIFRFHDHGQKRSTINPGIAKPELAPLRSRRRTTKEQQKNKKRNSTPPSFQSPIRLEPLEPKENFVKLGTTKNGSITIPNKKVFENVFETVVNKYRFIEELTDEKKKDMIDAAITAMVTKLGDKYSVYVEPNKSQDFRDELDGNFEGIGAYVEMIDDKFTITAPIKGSPAEAAGIKAGDIVTHVDGEPVANLSVNTIINMIKGSDGTKVELTILRENESKKYPVIRGKITIPNITLQWKKSVPIIGIHKFIRNTKNDFKKLVVNEVLPKNPKGIILDLRNNPGGFLTSAVEMGEFLLDKGEKVFSIHYRNTQEDYVSSRQGELFKQKNIVVLQNKGTASASEIFSAMIQDHKRGVVIGTKSTGKGTVQEIINYGNGGILKLTVAKWLTPQRRWIQSGKNDKHGVIPDIEVADPTFEQLKQDIDPQLESAIRYVLEH